MSMSGQDARGVVEGVVGAVAERYHREDVAAAIAAAVVARLEDGAYDVIAGVPELAERLTADLREVSGEDLLGVEYHAQATEPHQPPAPDGGQAGEVDNFGSSAPSGSTQHWAARRPALPRRRGARLWLHHARPGRQGPVRPPHRDHRQRLQVARGGREGRVRRRAGPEGAQRRQRAPDLS
jgi:hypothetical protein